MRAPSPSGSSASAVASAPVRPGYGELETLRPLLAGTVRRSPAGFAIDIGRHDVLVDGDADWLTAVLERCDGRTSVAEIAECHGSRARRLVVRLLDAGALVPAEHAWVLLHRQSSVGSALGRPIDDDELDTLVAVTYRPGGDLGPVAAPQAANSVVAALARRRRSTLVHDAARRPSVSELSAIVRAAGNGAPRGATVPSAGALRPLVVHLLVVHDLPDLRSGLWWSDPQRGVLCRLASAPADIGALFVDDPTTRTLLEAGNPIIFISADLTRPSRKYGARGYRYALIEAGGAMQTASLVATELGVPLRVIGGFDDGAVHALLEIPPSAVALLALLVGR